RLELQIGIIHADDRVVSDYILNRDRGVTHLHDLAVEGAVREGVNAEVNILVNRNRTNVSFGDVGVDLHFRQVIGDGENDRRLQTGGNGLPDIDAAGDHLAIHRRFNR